ncbi:hypothetical protein [Mycolicibacterium llatzerense]|uniref:hypothetical protein n=1 Tax=Mycolicibacterium llatzerense TaxID=280871 RepID=UPI0021B6C022|nr:hypothetical protein [Mycolicibacterium llatzerense]MCT7361272.1 hypothetical protein [Mycolicibacterium llatzerense]
MAGWSWFTAWPVGDGDNYRGSSMPMCCPGCGIDWSAVGFGLPIRGNVQRGWGSPPTGATAAVFYECLDCGWCAYDDRRGEYRRRPGD